MTQKNEEAVERVRDLAGENRTAKLRALGREQLVCAERDELRAQLDSIVNSRSWKLTQSLRNAAIWLRTLLGQGAKKAPPEKPIARAARDEVAGGHKSCEGGDESFRAQGRDAWNQKGSARLAALFQGETRLAFPQATECEVSIIVVLYNQAHLGLLCLESILRNADVPYQLILVDNNSIDSTRQLLEHVDGAEIIVNKDNVGFGRACMQGVERARGEYLCFLNNDALLGAGSLSVAVADFREDKSTGAIGGKILLADGRLQEAGSMVWNDGSTWGYGRGDNPELPRYEFRRPVDYCSAAFLFTPRTLFTELGGFDDRFSPAYYEDTDYCFKVWDKGLRVMYEPRAVVRHYESGSSENAEAAKGPISANRGKFVEKWFRHLQQHHARAGEHVPSARITVQVGGARILYLADPATEGARNSRQVDQVIAQLAELGHHLTVGWMSQPVAGIRPANSRRDIEYVDATEEAHYVFRELLSQYDAVWINGPSSMRKFLLHMRNMDARIPPIVYEAGKLTVDPEAINKGAPADEWAGKLEDQLVFGSAADVVLVTSEDDRQWLLAKGVHNVQVLSEQSLAEVVLGIRIASGKAL